MAAAIIRGRLPRGHAVNSQEAVTKCSPERRRSAFRGYPFSESTLTRQTSIATVTIPSRRTTETDFGSQPDVGSQPFWVPATGGPNAGSNNAAHGSGFPPSGFDRGGFGGFSGASASANPFGQGADSSWERDRWGKRGRGKGSTHKGKAPAGKAGGRPQRPGVDVRCPACGFLRNRREHDF